MALRFHKMISVELTFTLIKKFPNIKLLFEPSLGNIKVTLTGTYGERKKNSDKQRCAFKDQNTLKLLKQV